MDIKTMSQRHKAFDIYISYDTCDILKLIRLLSTKSATIRPINGSWDCAHTSGNLLHLLTLQENHGGREYLLQL